MVRKLCSLWLLLLQVGMVYDHANMWANIQVSAHPWEIHWQLNDHRFWRPFFGYQLQRRDIATVQTPPDYADREDLFYEQVCVDGTSHSPL